MYSIKQVAAMLGIPTVTLRAWENRYGAVEPKRTESGYRLYSEQDIEDLKWLKEQTEDRGMAISQAVRLLEETRRQQDSVLLATSARSHEERSACSQLSQQIYDALLQFDMEQGNVLIDLGFNMY